MKIFMSSLNLKILLLYRTRFPDTRINILLSFGNILHDSVNICKRFRKEVGSLILDSGVWTKNNAVLNTEHITVDSYMAYLRSCSKYFDFYFNFDENFDDNGFDVNYTNQLIMEGRGFAPVPVVHDIEGDEIQTYINRGYRRVALGSKQIKSRKTLEKVMRQFKETGIKVHLFGNTSFNLLAHAPINSCDAAMWARDGGWGNIRYWNPHKKGENKTDKIYLGEYVKPSDEGVVNFFNYKYRKDLEEYLRSNFNFSYSDLIGPKSAKNKMLVNLHYFVTLEKIITDIHRHKGYDTNDL